MINAIEFIVIYLSCGAPFGVYFFFQNKNADSFFLTVFKSFLVVGVWIPYAFHLLLSGKIKNFITKDFAAGQVSDSTPLKTIQDEIWNSSNTKNVSVFEFREVFERYAGLTAALKNFPDEPQKFSILTAVNHPDKILGAKCLQRRNRLRLEFHQTLAARDFLKMLAELKLKHSPELKHSVLNFVRDSGDNETLESVQKLFENDEQKKLKYIVKNSESEQWKTVKHKPLSANQISIR